MNRSVFKKTMLVASLALCACSSSAILEAPLSPPPGPPTASSPPPASAPEPPLPSSFTPNIPTGVGLALQASSDFGNLIAGQFNADGFAAAGDWENAAVSSSPFSAPSVFRTRYSGGILSNGDGGATLLTTEGHRWKRMYVSIAVFFPSNYSTHSLVEKFFYPVHASILTGETTGANCFCIKSAPGNSETGSSMALWLVPQTSSGPQLVDQGTAVYIRKGEWQLVEIYAVMNSMGQSNGVWQSWINGRQAVNRSDITYSTVNSAWVGARFTGTRGGGASTVPTPAGGQYRDYDRVVVYSADR